jgi:hypothetical protein
MTNLPRISPVDRARYPNGPLDRLDALETNMGSVQSTDIAAQSLNEIALDAWALNTSFPSICQGRLTLSSGVPVTNTTLNGNIIYFTPYVGNLIGIYNGTTWDQIVFSELQLPALQTQNGATHNGTAVIDGLTDTSQMIVGQQVNGTGIPITATIQSIDSATQITMTVNATASATVAVTVSCPQNNDFDVFIMDTGSGVLALRMVQWVAPDGAASITNVTNASPMVVTVPTHNMLTGQKVQIRNVLGATGANNVWRVGTVTGTTIQLLNFNGTNSAAGGVYTSGGEWQNAAKLNLRASALALQDGIYVLASNPLWRYLGTFRTVNTPYPAGANILTDGSGQRFLWNYYNRKQRGLARQDASATWSTAIVNTWLPDHNDISNMDEFIIGVLEDEIYAQKTVAGSSINNGVGLSSISFDGYVLSGAAVPVVYSRLQNNNAGVVISVMVAEVYGVSYGYINLPGYHYMMGQENVTSLANFTWRGGPDYFLSGYLQG